MRLYCQNTCNPDLIQDFFYSKSENNKLIQNIVFEYMDDNLEGILDARTKAKDHMLDDEVKVPTRLFRTSLIKSSTDSAISILRALPTATSSPKTS